MDWRDAQCLPVAELPLAFVDVETTGLWPESGDRVCEVAVVVSRGDAEAARFCTLVNPGRPLSPGAAAVNGLTDAMLVDAPSFASVVGEVAAALSSGIIVAHNAPFDLSFLRHEFALAGRPFPEGVVIDTLALARTLLPGQRCDLGSLAARFGIRVEGRAHRALADVLTTRALLGRLLAMCPVGLTLEELLVLQGRVPRIEGRAAPTVSLPPGLLEAVRPGEPLFIVYLDAQGRETRRVVEPQEVVVQYGVPCLVGFCRLRQEQRTFRLDRIVAWKRA